MTGFAPFYLMFGRVPRLPVDIMFGSVLRDNEVMDYDDYVNSFQKDLKEAIRIAQSSTTQAQKKQAEQYNKRVKGVALEIGDKVLLANRRERARGKLADLWDSTVYVITWKDPNVHVYRVEDLVTKKNKVVHRNFILPVNFLPIGQDDADSTVISTLSNDGSDIGWSEKGAPAYADEDYDDQRTAAWVLQTEGPEIRPYEVSRVDAQSEPRQDPVCSQDPSTEFFDDDSENKTDTGNSDDQWCEHNQSEDTLSNTTTSDSTLSIIDGSHDCLRHCSSVNSPDENVDEIETREEGVKFKGGTLHTRSGRLVKPVRRLIESMSMLMAEPGKKETLTALMQMLSTFVEI